MAKKAAKSTAAQLKEIDDILDDMREAVRVGLGDKKLGSGVEAALRAIMKPKIKRRLDKGGDWDKEKANPLIVAEHMGQIAALISKTKKVDISCAEAALTAVKSDEFCERKSGGLGGGDWCF